MNVRLIQRECLMMKYKYQSIFKDVFNSFVEEKHNLGFDYKTEEYKLKQLDELIIKEKILEIKLTKDLIEKYIAKRSFEKKINSINRIGVARELAKFMIRKGYKAYVLPPLPRGSYNREFVPYIFSDDELRRLFLSIDEWVKTPSLDGQYYNQRKKYPIILRILYSTGMRLNEVLSLRVKDIDFDKGTFTILKAKNQSERIIPIHENVLKILKNYINEEKIYLNDEYIFKGHFRHSHLSKSTVDQYFQKFLRMADIPHPKDGPRIHSFRHTFCVHRLKIWVTEGRDINSLFPYLCAYMGHADTRSTEYYLRLTADLYPDIVVKAEKHFFGENDDE